VAPASPEGGQPFISVPAAERAARMGVAPYIAFVTHTRELAMAVVMMEDG